MVESRKSEGMYAAPLEDTFNKVLSPLEDFIHRRTTGGLLLMAAAILALLAANSPWAEVYAHLLHLGGIRKVMPYFIVATLLWYALLQSGVHATLAGVLAAFTIPARPKYDAPLFSRRISHFLERFDHSHRADSNIMTNDELRTIVHSMEQDARRVGTPLQRMEHAWHLPVAFLIVPVFALCNAGIPLEIDQLGAVLRHPVTQGVMAGLVLGKFIGISGASWAALKLGIAQLPAGTHFKQIIGVSLLGGIGFTMAIFIAELGFGHEPEMLLMAKTGILAASVLAGVTGFAWLWLAAERKPG
ncbi:Na+:H+ antiporter, NhaA family [Novimethylophilus kurashikiensis]|uniref:Na+:H+ antiporter, NhaA family n=2 Tax=Novimethylophilus kurashikiensis TaxID=1825523 RepID=A0A2R5F4R3_9PROT|nr:Na+:H+ antiporter, NhaA family [Novimethylophilus kurashikiensis]